MTTRPTPMPALSQRLASVFALDPDRAAIKFGPVEFPWSWVASATADLDRFADNRRRIGVVLANRPGHAAATLATIGSGRCLVTLSAHHGSVMLAEDLEEYRPSVVAAAAAEWELPGFAEAVASIGAVGLLIQDDPSVPALSFRMAAPMPASPDTDDGVAVLMMTSGTTGRPKRVPLDYQRLTASFEASGLAAGPSAPLALRDDTPIVWTALVHIGGLYFLLADALEGKCTALMERFSVNEWAALVSQYRPAVVSLVPSAIRMVMDASVDPAVFEGVSAVRSGTAPLDPDLARAFEERYGIPVLTNYGATEFAGAVARWTLTDYTKYGATKRASSGRPAKGTDLRVVDQESGEELSVGEVGILEVRSPQLNATGWMRTTDLASLDSDGFLYIHGRSDDAVIRGGFKIVPSLVEDALRLHPAVLDAAMAGIADERLGAVPVAAVVLRESSAAVTEAELLEFLRYRLARYQVPVAIKVVDQLPRTPSMKVSRPALRELFADWQSSSGQDGIK